MDKKRSRYWDVLLGLFVVAGASLLFAIIFVIGEERRLFDKPIYLKAQFPNVAGLAIGADVMLAGVIVGYVSDIQFPKQNHKIEDNNKVTVTLRISGKMLPWIRKDSVARVDSKGLLGDKIINIDLGSPKAPMAKEGDFLDSIPPIDLNQALAKAQSILDNAADAVSGVGKVLEGFASEDGGKSLADAIKSLKNITQEVERGEGLIHHLIYDKKAGQNYQSAFASIDATAKHVEALMKEAESGQGMIHALFYDKEGAKTVRNLTKIFAEIDQVLTDIKKGPGILHDLIYDKKNQQIIANLNTASADLQNIVARVKNGEGTIGRLLVDPTVYEELKQILSKVRRNEVLKSLVRHAITSQETKPAE